MCADQILTVFDQIAVEVFTITKRELGLQIRAGIAGQVFFRNFH